MQAIKPDSQLTSVTAVTAHMVSHDIFVIAVAIVLTP